MTRRSESFLWMFAVLSLLLSLTAVRAAAPEPLPSRIASAAPGELRLVPAESLGARVLRVVASDPFRLARAPSPIPFGSPPAGSTPTAPAARVPDLQLRGVLGPPWRAVLEGVPGSEVGQLVRAGDSIAGARVVDVRAGAVTLQTPDTLWTLKMRRP